MAVAGIDSAAARPSTQVRGYPGTRPHGTRSLAEDFLKFCVASVLKDCRAAPRRPVPPPPTPPHPPGGEGRFHERGKRCDGCQSGSPCLNAESRISAPPVPFQLIAQASISVRCVWGQGIASNGEPTLCSIVGPRRGAGGPGGPPVLGPVPPPRGGEGPPGRGRPTQRRSPRPAPPSPLSLRWADGSVRDEPQRRESGPGHSPPPWPVRARGLIERLTRLVAEPFGRITYPRRSAPWEIPPPPKGLNF